MNHAIDRRPRQLFGLALLLTSHAAFAQDAKPEAAPAQAGVLQAVTVTATTNGANGAVTTNGTNGAVRKPAARRCAVHGSTVAMVSACRAQRCASARGRGVPEYLAAPPPHPATNTTSSTVARFIDRGPTVR